MFGSLARSGTRSSPRPDTYCHNTAVAPKIENENAFIEKNGIAEFAKWHLGEDSDATEGTKGRYLIPYGDFAKVHRCGVISGESRAGKYNHPSVENAMQELLSAMDKHADRK